MRFVTRLLGVTLIVMLIAGCARTRSELAGTWLARSKHSEVPLVVLRIRPDGSFDWGQTLTGRVTGLSRLRKTGDHARGPSHPELQFSIVWHDYQPDRSRVVLLEESLNEQGGRRFDLAYHDASLETDGMLDYRVIGFASQGAPKAHAARLTRCNTHVKSHEPFSGWLEHPKGEILPD